MLPGGALFPSQPPEPADGPSLIHPLCQRLTPSPSPQHTARTLGQVLPLSQLEALTPPSGWWHQDGCIPLPSLPIAAWMGSPMALETDGHPHHWLLLQHDGHATLLQHHQELSLAPGNGLLLPGRSFRLITNACSTTALPIPPQLLLDAANAMAPSGWFPSHSFPLRQPRQLGRADDGHAPILLEALHQLLPSLVQLAPLQPPLLESLAPGEPFLRLLAALVFPELGNGTASQPPKLKSNGRSHRGDKRLDPLLTFIQANLEEALPLQVLERVSNDSRRTLHYAFQERFGCTPMQWIRQQRLARAHHRLLHPKPGDTVTSISLGCGYRSLGRFNTDFQRMYGAKPSVVLRQAGLSPKARSNGLHEAAPSEDAAEDSLEGWPLSAGRP
jgi:AraC-like DNA-binding protein